MPWEMPHMWWVLDKSGQPQPVADVREMLARKLPDDHPYMNVGHETLHSPDGRVSVFLSTKMLSLNMRHFGGPNDPPLLWETMAFLENPERPEPLELPDGSNRERLEKTWGQDLCQLRYSSLKAAQANHARVRRGVELLLLSPEAADYEWARTFLQGFLYGEDTETDDTQDDEQDDTIHLTTE